MKPSTYSSTDLANLASISGGGDISDDTLPSSSSMIDPPTSLLTSFSTSQISFSSTKSIPDPPKFSTLDKKRPVSNLQQILYPIGHCILSDWKPEVTSQTDTNGWQYADDFISSSWSECVINPNDNYVRHRKWQRLTISINDYDRAIQHLRKFQENLNLFRSISPNIIQCIFENEPYHLQMILEFQRSLNGEYSSDYLLPTDPSQWSSGYGEYALINPKFLEIHQLKEVVGAIYNGGDGWETLHDFIYQIAPDTDSQGWQYNTSFLSDSHEWQNSSNSELNMMNVRRRLWFRTCVPDEYLESMKEKLLSYYAKRPRGVIKSGNIQRQGQFKVLWYDAYATLTDTELEIILLKYERPFGNNKNSSTIPVEETSTDDWYLGKNLGLKKPLSSLFGQSNTSINTPTPASTPTPTPTPKQFTFLGGGIVKYPLYGCEIIELSEHEDEGRDEITNEEIPKKNYQFGLRTGKSWGKYYFTTLTSTTSAGTNTNPGTSTTSTTGLDEPDSICRYTIQEDYHLLCVLNTYNQQDYHDWICILRNQIALINLHFWPFLGSPPILDKVLIEGYMWIKSGPILKKWKYRKFELRQNGILVYYKKDRNIIIGKIRLRLCYIEDCEDELSYMMNSETMTCSPFLKVLRSDSTTGTSSGMEHQEYSFQIRNDVEGYEIQLKTSTYLDKIQWMKALKDHSNIEKILKNEGFCLIPPYPSSSSHYTLLTSSPCREQTFLLC